MRADGQDIVELFGFGSADNSIQARQFFQNALCPFVSTQCTKTNHDKTVVYGTCSVTTGRAKREAIICPKRLYADNYRVLHDAAVTTWGEIPLVAGGGINDLRNAALHYDECAVAFGQNSGREVSINSNGKMSLDWVIQRYKRVNGHMEAQDYIGIEVQSIDITGNYRDNWQAYKGIRSGSLINYVPDAGHGLNWANVHKRLIPQIIRKGNVYSGAQRCSGFFFILPDLVYEKFEDVLGELPEKTDVSRFNLSILTYGLSAEQVDGQHRKLVLHRRKHHSLDDISHAFITRCGDSVSQELDDLLGVMI